MPASIAAFIFRVEFSRKLFGIATVLLLFAWSLPVLPAQTAAGMAAVLESDAVTWTQAAGFVLPAAGLASGDPASAFDLAKTRGWLPKNAEPGALVDFGGLSFLIMEALDIPGGLMYRLFPGPRYAYRELLHMGVIQGRQDSSRRVSGFWLLALISRTLELRGLDE
jgi:hypothetical protein